MVPTDYQTLFLDMNSFFASVEQQVRPELRGRPVGVAPYAGNSGCIIAASYEAKSCGVRTGTRVGDAKAICPGITILESRPALYLLYHKEIKKVIEAVTPYYQPLSVDEFSLRLTPDEQKKEISLELAKKIKQKINRDVGDYLRCSIGIGPNTFLAKVASERKKPDGLTIVRLDSLAEFYSSLALTDLTGINFRLEARLNFHGVYNSAQLWAASVSELRRILGHAGRVWYFRLRGYEVDDNEIKSKTIGHSHVLEPKLRSRIGALAVIEKLIFKIGHRLRQQNYFARGVAVSIGFLNHTTFHRSKKTVAFCDQQTLRGSVEFLLQECEWTSSPIRIAISTFDLVRLGGHQYSLFDQSEKSGRLSSALDMVNDRFGAETIYPAAMTAGLSSAPDRIPFGRPRYDITY